MPARQWRDYDVIVVGGGNAALCAAHAASETGARTLVLEKAPRAWAGGNSRFTAGATRTTFNGLDDLRPLLPDLSDELAAITDIPAYTPDDFSSDMYRVTEGRCDPELTAILVNEIAGSVRWLHGKGVRWRLMYDRQSFKIEGRHRFWGGLVLGVDGQGVGLIEQHLEIAAREGVEVRFESPVIGLLRDEQGAVTGVRVGGPHGRQELTAGAVVLACGGFEADPRMRAAYLGQNWDMAKVRGTPYNTGEGIEFALAVGAQPFGNWSGCHSIQWDAGAPPHGDLDILHRFSKQSYPIGIVVNREARRFLDEGADFRNFTYAKYGAEILKQPGAVAWQLFDAKTAPLLRQDEYSGAGVTRVEAGTIRELAERVKLDPESLERTVAEFNAAARPLPFNPAIKDGKRTDGITPPKSNWAVPLDTPPFLAFPITCGITFTFGGLRIDGEARALDRSGHPIRGLHAAGELVGGLFYYNYPGGSGLTSGIVFGRRAGTTAGRAALVGAARAGN